MKLHINKLLSISCLVVTFSCTAPESIPGLEKTTWVNDKTGCTYRNQAIDILLKNKNLLEGKRERDIRLILGEPDRQELYVRGQKFFYFTIASPSICEVKDSVELELRFSALGMISEVMTISY